MQAREKTVIFKLQCYPPNIVFSLQQLEGSNPPIYKNIAIAFVRSMKQLELFLQKKLYSSAHFVCQYLKDKAHCSWTMLWLDQIHLIKLRIF